MIQTDLIKYVENDLFCTTNKQYLTKYNHSVIQKDATANMGMMI